MDKGTLFNLLKFHDPSFYPMFGGSTTLIMYQSYCCAKPKDRLHAIYFNYLMMM